MGVKTWNSDSVSVGYKDLGSQAQERREGLSERFCLNSRDKQKYTYHLDGSSYGWVNVI